MVGGGSGQLRETGTAATIRDKVRRYGPTLYVHDCTTASHVQIYLPT